MGSKLEISISPSKENRAEDQLNMEGRHRPGGEEPQGLVSTSSLAAGPWASALPQASGHCIEKWEL